MPSQQGARRVAEAILSMARERGDFDAWLRDLQTLHALFGADDALFALDHPDVPFEDKQRMIERTASNVVRPEGLRVVYYLVRKRRAHLLAGVLQALQGLVNEERNIRVADVTSAAPLEPFQEEALSRGLGQRFGGTVTLNTRVDPSILGGVVVRVGDLMLDGSVSGRLLALRDQLVRAAN